MARRGRRPEPWKRKQTGSWYVTLDGEQVPLGKDEPKAYEEFYRLMAARGEGPAAAGNISVRRLRDAWLAWCGREGLSGRTVANYRLYSDSFVALFGNMRARDLKRFHINQWTASLEEKWGKPWSQSTRSLAIAIIKALTSWGDDEGLLDDDPLRKVKVAGFERRDPISMKEAQGIMDRVRDEIKDALRVLLTTGVRPGELCSMEAEKTDLEEHKAIVEGKTGRRTVYLGVPAVETLAAIVKRRPKGRLFLNVDGDPLTVAALEQCVTRARRALSQEWFGKGKDMNLEHIKPHCFRGLFSTEALRAGVSYYEVAKLIGHKDPTILAKHYASPDDEMLRGAADRATRRYGNSSDKPQDPPD